MVLQFTWRYLALDVMDPLTLQPDPRQSGDWRGVDLMPGWLPAHRWHFKDAGPGEPASIHCPSLPMM
jgi:hypothetical protein